MKKLLFIFTLIISTIASGQVPYASEYPVEKFTNWRFRNNDTVTFHQLTIEDKGRWLPNGQIDYIAGLGPYTWPTSITAGTKVFTIDGTTKVISFTDYAGIGLGDGSFLGLDDVPDSYSDHANQLTYVTTDEDSLIFTKGLTWNGLLDSALLIVNDNANGGFAHMSNDFSEYALFNYRNIGLTDGVSSLNIFPNRIEPPNIRWNGGESYLNWSLAETIDSDEGPINWYFHPFLRGAGTVLADSLGDGHLRLMNIADIITSIPYSEVSGGTSQHVAYFNSSGFLTGNPMFLIDDTDYTFAIGTTNSENFNFSLTDPTGRAENVTTGYGAETQVKTRYANGSQASPTAVISGDALGVFGFGGYDGTSYTGDVDAGMKAISTENWNSGAHGNYLLWAIKPTGTNTLDKQMRLDENGLNIGAFGSHSYMLDVNGDVNIASGSNYKINGTNISTTNVAEGSNQYFTDERVDDRVDALVVDGSNITTSYNDGANTLTISSSYKTMVAGQPATTIAASTTSYGPIFGQTNFNGTEANRQMIMPFDGTASSLYVRTSGTQSATGSMVVTVRKNGAATTLTCTIAAGSGTGTFTDVSNSFSFVAGDRITVQFVNNATATSTTISCFSFMIK